MRNVRHNVTLGHGRHIATLGNVHHNAMLVTMQWSHHNEMYHNENHVIHFRQ
jgi:hypothetical protein